jgi:membrane protein DedA with SNARE-associated domain
MHLTLAIALHHRFHGPHFDYIGVGLAAVASWIGVSGVGEAALIAGGIAAAHGKVDISSILFVAWVGAMAGGAAGWLVGIKGGRALMERKGPLYRLRLRLLRRGDELYEKRGLLAVYLTPSPMAGIAGMRFGRFLVANAITALAWVLLVGLGAYFAGPSVAEWLGDLSTVALVLLAAAAAVSLFARWRWKRARRPPPAARGDGLAARPEEAAGASAAAAPPRRP